MPIAPKGTVGFYSKQYDQFYCLEHKENIDDWRYWEAVTQEEISDSEDMYICELCNATFV